MVKLPMSDYVADYYKKQGITFTFRQQACLCWNYDVPEYKKPVRSWRYCDGTVL